MKSSAQTKSFVILGLVALAGTFVCLALWSNLLYQKMGQEYYNYTPTATAEPTPSPVPNPAPVSTSNWKTYSNPTYKFSFLYSPGWKVLAAKKMGNYELIQVDPGAKYYDINIYVSPVGYYIMGGLPVTQDAIGGQAAQNVNNELYGVQANGLYYTFDVGWSMSLVPQFDALVHSVSFGNK